VTALALAVDGLFAVVQRLVIPRGVVAAGRAPDSARTSSRPAASTTS
jgi:osmoprotectant transport system permease protein